MTWKKGLTAPLLAFFCLLLLGCTGNEYERRTDATDTLYVGEVESSFPTSFMPWLSRDGVAPTIASLLYSTLFTYDEDTGEFLPQLAKEWCFVDPSGNPLLTEDGKIDYDRLEEVYASSSLKYLTVRIVLEDGILWSDGVPMTAEDVYYSFDIAANNALSNHAGALAWVSDLQHTYASGVLTKQGIFTYGHGANEAGYPISEDEKDTVLYLRVNKVLGAVTTLFTTILILPEHVWEPVVTETNQLNSKAPTDETLYRYSHPVGCGPYVLDTEATNGAMIVLRRYEDYHLKEDDGSPLYKASTIKFILYQEENVAIYALLKGHIDVLDQSVSSNYLSLFQSRDDLFVADAEGTFTQTLVLNLNPVSTEQNPMRALLGNLDFRHALALAVDQEELIGFVLNGAGIPISAGLMSESLPDFYNPASDILRQDPIADRIAEANLLLDAIVPDKDGEGYRLLEGKRVSFEILGSPAEQDLVSRLQVQFQKIGIEVAYAAKGSSPEKTYLYTSKFDMTLQGVIFSLSNIDIMYKAHFVTLGTSSNYGRLRDSALTAKIDEMRTTLNLTTKYALIEELQLMIAEEYYKIPLYSSDVITVARTDRFSGFVPVKGQSIFNTETLQHLVRLGEGE